MCGVSSTRPRSGHLDSRARSGAPLRARRRCSRSSRTSSAQAPGRAEGQGTGRSSPDSRSRSGMSLSPPSSASRPLATLRDLMEAMQKALLPDLTPGQFADMYAQTIAYGLFAACCNHRGPGPFRRWERPPRSPKPTPSCATSSRPSPARPWTMNPTPAWSMTWSNCWRMPTWRPSWPTSASAPGRKTR